MKKSELLRIPKQEKTLQKMETRLQVLKEKARSPKAPRTFSDQVQATGAPANSLIDYVIDLENEVQARREALKESRQTAARIFRRLDDERREIMTLYYIVGMSWQQVAECMALSEKSVYRKRREALDLLTRKSSKPAEDPKATTK